MTFLFIVVFYVLVIIAGSWIYVDAKRRGESGGQWFFLLLIGNLITLIVWLIVRPTEIGDDYDKFDDGIFSGFRDDLSRIKENRSNIEGWNWFKE